MRSAPRRRRRSALAFVRPAAVLAIGALLGSVAGASLADSHTPEPTPLAPGQPPSPLQTELRTPEPSRSPPALSAPAALLVGVDTRQVLYGNGVRQRRAIASVTKIMTALLVLESVDPGEVVTVSAEAARQAGSLVGLEAGERITVENLLYALLLGSANDAAVALAVNVGGSVEAFVERMNRRARRMGLRDTLFATPSGLDTTGYSTASDVARLTLEALEVPVFGEIVRTKVREISAPGGGSRRIQSRNVLLWLYPGATGVKSGFTAQAGYTVSAAAERDGMSLVAVVLGSPVSAFDDAAALLEHGFTAFEAVTVIRRGEPVATLEVGGAAVPVLAGTDLVRLIRRGGADEIEVVLRARPGLTAPTEPGARVGRLVVLLDGRRIGSAPAVAGETEPEAEPERDEPTVPRVRGFQAAMRLLAAMVRFVVARFL